MKDWTHVLNWLERKVNAEKLLFFFPQKDRVTAEMKEIKAGNLEASVMYSVCILSSRINMELVLGGFVF